MFSPIAVWGSSRSRLLDLDFTQPAQQSFPTTATGVLSGRTASYIWTFEETSGNFTDELNSEALVVAGGVEYANTAVGFWNGSDAFSKKAVETDGSNNDPFAHASGTFLDLGTTDSLAVLIVWRTVRPLADHQTLFQKRGTGAGIGYEMRMDSSGYTRWVIVDDAANTFTCGDSSTGNTHDDGAWHVACGIIDRTNNELRFITDTGTDTTDISTMGDISNTGVTFGVGKRAGSMQDVQIAYCAVFEGAEAEAITQSDIDAFWTHGSVNTDPVISYDRDSTVRPIIGYEPGFGVRVATYGAHQFAHGYNENFSHASQLGAVVEDDETNLLTHSCQPSGWTRPTVSMSADVEEDPSGTNIAYWAWSTVGDNEQFYQDATTTADKDITLSFFVKTAVSNHADCRLIAHDGTSEIDSTSFTTTDEWQRVQLTVNHPGTTTRFIVELGLQGTSYAIATWGFQMEYGSKASSFIYTESSTASRVQPQLHVTESTPGEYVNPEAGEARIATCGLIDRGGYSLQTGLFGWLDDAGTSKDRVDAYVLLYAGERAYVGHWDSAETGLGHISCFPTTPDWESFQTTQYRWDANNDFWSGYHRTVHTHGDTVYDEASGWTTTSLVKNIRIGAVPGYPTARSTNGLISRFTIFDAA